MVDASNAVELDAAATLLLPLGRRCDCCRGCCWCFFPPAPEPSPGERFDGEYRHTRPTVRQREQTGRALEHLTLAMKQPSQEARRRGWRGGMAVVVARGGEEEWCCFDGRPIVGGFGKQDNERRLLLKGQIPKGSYNSIFRANEVSSVLVGVPV